MASMNPTLKCGARICVTPTAFESNGFISRRGNDYSSIWDSGASPILCPRLVIPSAGIEVKRRCRSRGISTCLIWIISSITPSIQLQALITIRARWRLDRLLIYPALRTGLMIGAPSALDTRALSMAARENFDHTFGIRVRRPFFPMPCHPD